MWARQVDGLALTDSFTSPRLAKTLRRADAHGVALVAVSAGQEVVEESQKLWREENPTSTSFWRSSGPRWWSTWSPRPARDCCAWPKPATWPCCRTTVRVMAIGMCRSSGGLLHAMSPPFPLDVMESGMLRPKKSMLAVFGLTRHTERLRQLSELVPCQSCSFGPCQYRRAPFGAAPVAYKVFNVKALRRWAAERLSLERRDGMIHARIPL